MAALLLAMGIVACGESDPAGPPMPGAISVTTETSGFLLDDGYDLLVDGVSAGTIGANDVMTVSDLDPASHALDLGDVADNCTVQGASVDVVSEQTADVVLAVDCTYPTPTTDTLRMTRDRPNLDTGDVIDCIFGLCPTPDEWDFYVHFDSKTTPNSVIRQNQTTGVEIAHLPGVSLASMTQADFEGATFTTSLVPDAFDAGRVILIRTDLGNVYVLGNPVEDSFAQKLTFDVTLLATP